MDEREPAPTQSLTFLAQDFVAGCLARGLSLRTVGWYNATPAREFPPWCASEEILKAQRPHPPQVVGRFTARLIERKGPRGPLSRSTVRSYVRAVRVFLAWAQTPEGGAAAVGASPRLPRPEQRVWDVLTREEIQAMENAAKTERDKLLVRVLADCGLRLGEVLALRAEDLWEPRRSEFALKVKGQGQPRQDRAPRAGSLRASASLPDRSRGRPRRDPVFVALRKGADGRYAPLTKSGLEQAVRSLAREAGIEKPVYPHVFRHSFATEWLRRGGNIISLQRILGHSDLTMIQGVYSHLDTSDDYQAGTLVLLGQD